MTAAGGEEAVWECHRYVLQVVVVFGAVGIGTREAGVQTRCFEPAARRCASSGLGLGLGLDCCKVVCGLRVCVRVQLRARVVLHGTPADAVTLHHVTERDAT
ncbi:hypothetical protein QJQ45_021228 [Haematococcus lacustris]|nr:hypothetical protein QJQ45_030456 [Haematococcus lacustris]KAJ9507887.1 hypothetical protein QJQ45_021228 [Haematococcus lacustris]